MDGRRLILMAMAAIVLLLPQIALAQLEWSHKLLDFGTIKEEDGKAVRHFMAVNKGETPVRIDRVRTSCGCTTAEIDTTPIQPGDSIALPIMYNPAGRPGPFDKLLFVFSGKTSYKLNIIGNVIPSERTLKLRYPVVMESFRMTKDKFVFGDMPIGSRRTKRLYGYNASPDTVVLKFNDLPEQVVVRSLPDTVPPSGLFCLSATFIADRRSDFGTADLLLKMDANGRIIPITATYTMKENPGYDFQSGLEKVPVAVFEDDRLLFEGYGEKRMRRLLKIKNTGNEVLRISGITSADDAVSVDAVVPLTVAPGKSVEMNVTVDGSKEKNDVLNSALIILTNDPANPNKLIRLVGKR